MAKAYQVTHKCLVKVGGEPMLLRVIRTLNDHPAIGSISVCIEKPELLDDALGPLAKRVRFEPPQESAARSALAVVKAKPEFPWLVTTGDHPLLTQEMLQHFLAEATKAKADICAGLAT